MILATALFIILLFTLLALVYHAGEIDLLGKFEDYLDKKIEEMSDGK